jgi:hypothetical protein
MVHDLNPHGSRARGAIAVLLGGVALLTGCGNENDEALWGGQMSPTQVQQADQGPGPMTMPDPADGDSEDPYTGDPNFPYSNGPGMGAVRDSHE